MSRRQIIMRVEQHQQMCRTLADRATANVRASKTRAWAAYWRERAAMWRVRSTWTEAEQALPEMAK